MRINLQDESLVQRGYDKREDTYLTELGKEPTGMIIRKNYWKNTEISYPVFTDKG